MTPTQTKQLKDFIAASQTVLLLQPDKPDGDSLASALALEEILCELGKKVHHFCAGRVEPYLSFLPGWDRVGDEWPKNFDSAIIVDIASDEQAPRLIEAHKKELLTKPVLLLDHHIGRSELSFVSLALFDEAAASAGEMIFKLAIKLKWPITPAAAEYMICSIQSDTLNLTTDLTTANTVESISKLMRVGDVNLGILSRRFRDATALDPDILQAKGRLLSQLEFYADNQIALLVVPKETIEEYRQRTSLSAIVLYDMLNARGIKLAAVMSDYGTIIRTSIRSRLPIAAEIATHFGGGGHDRAAAFPTTDKTVADLKIEFIKLTAQHINAHTDK